MNQPDYAAMFLAPAPDAVQLRRLSVPSRAELEALDDGSGQLVYFVRCLELVKIGTARDVRDRLSALQVGCPYELILWGTLKGGHRAEQALHAAFWAYRMRGEWFAPDALARGAMRHLLNIDDQGRQR
jgi:hypothetical protein